MAEAPPPRPARTAPVDLVAGEAGAPDPRRCPLCGGPNACGRAAGEPRCWCFDAEFPASLAERVPAQARGAACVCQSCADAALRREREEATTRD